MLAAPPQLPAFGYKACTYVQIAWPIATIIDGGGFRGFVMPEVNFRDSTELENILQKSVRKRKQLPEFYGTRVLLAANLAALMAELHALGHYMVDMKPMNMRFYPEAWYMAILDTDGFSINGKRRQPARQFSDEYIAPEAKGKKPEQLGQEQDLFALAVIIFRLLNNGIHPYQGIDTGNYPTTLQERIFAGLYAYGTAGRREVKPARSSIHQFLEDDTRLFFDEVFQVGSSRPSAAEWRDHLSGLIGNKVLVRCSRDPKNHGHFSKGCGFCNLERQLTAAAAARTRAPSNATRPVQSSGQILTALHVAKGRSPGGTNPRATPAATVAGGISSAPSRSRIADFWIICAVVGGLVVFALTQQEKSTTASVTSTTTTTPLAAQPEAGSPPIERAALSQPEIDALRARLMSCWSPPIGVTTSNRLVVVVKFSLSKDGAVSGEPTVINRGADPLFKVAAESAIRAIRSCQPYRLPTSKYEAWRDIEVKFDPNDLTRPPSNTDPATGSTPTTRLPDFGSSRQKVVLYEEDQSDPAGKRYPGSAVWRTDQVAPAPGQLAQIAIRADIDIPEQKMGIRWSLRRNDDKALPASHTVEIVFTLPPDFPHGGISNIPGVLMKQGESTRGVPLVGLAVKVTNNFFLVGLSSVDTDMQRNLQLLKERSWFDIPVVYGDGKRAIIVIEKGTAGEHVFSEAFLGWRK
jgi:hypothetical protein